ncbi:MAG: alpha/beta hydrolase, partial [Saprospiraceae bacterium]|nr:alpha/beta hydrolase [Saprospiraceae bacterium]
SAYQLEDRYFISSRKDLSLPGTPKAQVQKNISYSGLPGTKRKLWCDIWEPPEQIKPSGLALIYLHGSAWYLFDKDLGTRPFFNHLAAQGHVIMDVAYRLAPEADMMDMIQDVKRAIGWLKDNALRFRIDPEKIVLSGGSAGGHLALMAAYTAGDLAFSPSELVNEDLHVQGAISLYGPSDLKEIYYHTRQDITTRKRQGKPEKKAPKGMPKWVKRAMGKDFHRLGLNKGFENAGALAPILGGHPEEKPETYRFFSPIEHVSPDCPPTLIIHGQHDLLAPVSSSQRLYKVLQKNKVISYLHLFPQTDHAFDLILPGISCSSHNAIYDIERFLAILSENTANNNEPETSDETQVLSDVNDLIFI